MNSTHTVRCQRRMGVTPISRARLAHVVGPTCALTAAFMTRVGRCGKDELTYSVAKRPRRELPRVASEALVVGSGRSGCCCVCSWMNEGCVHACSITSVDGTTVASPMRCANAARVERGGGWEDAQECASKTAGAALAGLLVPWPKDCFGRAFRCCEETWASFAAVFATFRCA